MTNTKKFRNCLLLLTAAIIWGMAFVSQQAGMDFMGPLTFNGSRNIIGSVILVPVILIIRGRIPKAERKPLPVKTTIIGGLACGAALTIASTLQQYGLTMTTVGKGGFITTLYIILTPILGIFIGRKAPKAVWFCAVLAVAGMFLLCVNGESLSISAGDLLVLGSALVFAVHILVIDHFSPLTDGVILSCIQFAVCGVVSTIGAFIFEQPSWEQLVSGAIPVLYAGVLSCGVGYTLQIVGQKGVDPTAAALILSMESVVATISGFVAYKIGFLRTDQSMSPRQIIGCYCVCGCNSRAASVGQDKPEAPEKSERVVQRKKRRRPDCIFVRSAPLALAKCEIIPVLKPRDPVILGKRRRGDIKVLHILRPFNITPFVVAV